ncbi:hypothetical protein HF519_24230 [Pseudonocardia bannensis]|uniref:SCO6045-like C-terminal domain-containing protein n=1 Tax=Pseudonocardia bannensis TaxID=630973 RepID=A0A848DQN8_9PSEU|nr:hypothetical protein [Pseudonocardia bannensis]
MEPESPPPTPAERTGLAARQAELVAALVAGGPLPGGFDPGRLAATRRALLRKRAGQAAQVWPLLAASVGQAWPDSFAAHAGGRPPAGALRDGWDVARALRAAGVLGAGGAEELAGREVGWYYDGVRPPRRRRLPAVRRAGAALFVQVAGRTLRWAGRRA